MFPTDNRSSQHESGTAITSNSRGHWLDDQCHRSIYSAQARAAIALSLEGQRHHAITFVSYACSGAEITDGLFWPQDHRECTGNSPARERLHQPQISGVIEALSASAARYSQFSLGLESEDLYYKRYIKRMEVLGATAGLPALRKTNYTCASWPGRSEIRRNAVLRTAGLNRPIDLMLVSIGGNDVGFGPLVSKAVINSGVASASLPIITERAIRKYQQEAGAITLDEANARMGFLDRRFLMLNTAIIKKFEMSTPSRVMITAYPRLTKTQNGFCGPGNRGMNVSTFFATVEGEAPNRVTPKSADGIVAALNGKIRSIAERYGWSYVEEHVSKFVGHSFCDSDSGATSVNRFIESMDIPHRGRAAPNSPWLAFEPTKDFYPYESRKRWVRTFNDAYLLSFYFKGSTAGAPAVDDDIGIYQAQRALGGPMHPSAEGHAHMADAIVERARKLLFIDGLAVPLGE